jgi:hypothetical protein
MKKKINVRKSKKNTNKMILATVAIILVLAVIFLVNLNIPRQEIVETNSFEECLQEGYLVMESYPRQCRTPEGKLFVEELTLEESCKNLYSGKWLPEHNECENINEEQCALLNGEFNECASACRHDPSAEFCIAVCVSVCKF